LGGFRRAQQPCPECRRRKRTGDYLGPLRVANAQGYSGPPSLACKRFDAVVPTPGDPSSSSGQGIDEEDRALTEKVEAGFETVVDRYNACKFRAAPSVPSGQAWVRRWRRPAKPTVTLPLHSVQAWTASRPASRSRRTARQPRPECTSSCASRITQRRSWRLSRRTRLCYAQDTEAARVPGV
jgi:hypothetical protein